MQKKIDIYIFYTDKKFSAKNSALWISIRLKKSTFSSFLAVFPEAVDTGSYLPNVLLSSY